MPRSRNLYKCQQCRASQKCYNRPQYANSGRGECCRYDRNSSPRGSCHSVVSETELAPTAAGKPSETKAKAHSSTGLQYDSSRDSGYDDSTGESSCHEDSDLSLSATSACSSEFSLASKLQHIPYPWKTRSGQLMIGQHDLEQRRQALRRVFQCCNQTEFNAICCAISLVLNSARPLSRRELAAATILYSLGRDWRTSMEDEQWTEVEHWLRKCSPILAQTPDGQIAFLRPAAMRVLLFNFSIQGIDTSHRTMGLICRNLIELNRHLLTSEICQDVRPDVLQSVQAFAQYVTEFGEHHLRTASLTSMIVVGDHDSCSDINDGFEMISKCAEQLSISTGRAD